MFPKTLLIYPLFYFAFFVLAYGQDVVTKVAVCDEDAFYACLCDETSKYGASAYAVGVICSVNLTEINNDMLLPQFIDRLDLSMNQITKIVYSDVLVSLTMASLFLSKNKISSIAPNSFQDLPNLRELDLSDNELETIDSTMFHGICKLQYLYLSANKLKTLKPNVFQYLPKLDMLVLDNNNLGDFLTNQSDIFSTSGLSINPKISYLHLGYTNLSYIPPDYFRSAYNMRHLNLAGNPINVFPQLPYTLEALDISNTEISSLSPKDFVNLPAIKELFLNDLKNLTEIGNHTFHSLVSLNKIELQNCKNLKHFSPYAFGINAMDDNNEEYSFPVLDINFMGSGLRSLDEKLITLFSRLTNLDLRSNPWNCDCKIQWLLDLHIEESDKEFIICNRPPEHKGKQVWSLKTEDLDCKAWSITISGVTRVALVFLCIVLSALALWLVMLWPPQNQALPPRVIGPDSPYSRITIQPNRAEDV